jgi:hypothetical protein
MFGHHDELVQLESALLLVSVESFQEESSVGLDNKKSSALPGCESYERCRVGTSREWASRHTSAAGSRRVLAYYGTAEAVPFPVEIA